MPADGKMIVNDLYHSAVVTGLAIGYAKLMKMALGGVLHKLDYTHRDITMVILDIGIAMATKETLIKQGIIPNDILK